MLIEAACVVVLLAGVQAESWRWPTDSARAASVRIDTKVRFVDDERRPNKVQADEIKAPSETDGFYNRPATGAGSGRYAVQSEPHSQRLTAHDLELMKLIRPQAYSDGTLDSLQYCKCVSSATASCHSRGNSGRACPSGQSLCCYKRPNRNSHSESGIFSELEDERPMLLPNHERRPGLFSEPDEDLIGALEPAADGYQNGGSYRGLLFGPGGPTGIIGPGGHRENRVLVGPSGPTGHVGPSNKQVLVGSDGPTGIVGPNHRGSRYQEEPNSRNPGLLVGPEGPTGVIGPNHGENRYPGHNQRNPGILIGPEGPTGVIGLNHGDNRIHMGPNQRNPGVLVGPDGPTGVIGPNNHENIMAGHNERYPGVLVGPDGLTGVVGPGHRGDRDFPGPGLLHPGVLVGPEGPTGHIGVPHREPQVLVGPGGPTGGIGPDHKKGVHAQGAQSAQVLIGPGGPTGIIGPGGRRGRWQTGPGILVGPGGPTGIIGPGRRLLVGPGGPTGRIGPRGYGYGF